MNEQNLIPLNKRPERERKEIQRKGAYAANKKMAEIKTMREAALAFLKGDIPMEELKGNTGAVAVTIAVAQRLLASGDPTVYNALMTIAGEKPKETLALESETVKAIKIKFVDKSSKNTKTEKDPKICGDYTPPSNVKDTT